MTSPRAARAAQLANLAHQLTGEEHTWTGSPLTASELEDVAATAAGLLDHQTLLKGLRESTDPAGLLHGLLAIAWAAGFKTGSMFVEEQRS